MLEEVEVEQVDAILADLGISTNQLLFDEQYGLSFAAPMATLDMRLDPRIRRSAANLVNNLPEEELADVLYTSLADERYSRRIARKIAEARRISPITTTDRLADLVRSAVPVRPGQPQRIDPATRTFMALRMAVVIRKSKISPLPCWSRLPKFLKPGGSIGRRRASIRWKTDW